MPGHQSTKKERQMGTRIWSVTAGLVMGLTSAPTVLAHAELHGPSGAWLNSAHQLAHSGWAPWAVLAGIALLGVVLAARSQRKEPGQ
jgi:hypothetical protein